MARALQLARRGMYTTRPNPRVGCVIVNDNVIVGEGWHVKAGTDHAEIIALKQAGKKARGATCYVSLEPCAHTGRTPPCTGALIETGIAKVIAAMVDPNPRVAGNGLSILNKSGIEALSGLLETEANTLNPGFIKRMRTGMPYVRCKLAMSLDGKTALESGESKWITGPQSRRDVQRLRAGSCAVVTGTGTVLTDDPGLTVRDINEIPGQPIRVVLDRRLRFPVNAKMLEQPGRTIIFTENSDQVRRETLIRKGAEVIVVDDKGFLAFCLRYLAQHNEVNEVLVEAGPTLAGSMIKYGLVDELILYQAPAILGDRARSLFALPGIERMEDRINVKLFDLRQVGDDLRFIYHFNN